MEYISMDKILAAGFVVADVPNLNDREHYYDILDFFLYLRKMMVSTTSV